MTCTPFKRRNNGYRITSAITFSMVSTLSWQNNQWCGERRIKTWTFKSLQSHEIDWLYSWYVIWDYWKCWHVPHFGLGLKVGFAIVFLRNFGYPNREQQEKNTTQSGSALGFKRPSETWILQAWESLSATTTQKTMDTEVVSEINSQSFWGLWPVRRTTYTDQWCEVSSTQTQFVIVR